MRVTGGPLAPAGVKWTTLCNMIRTQVLRGGPLDSVLNTARAYNGQVCPAVAASSEIVILRYPRSTRRLVINLGGCPGVLLNDGTELVFANSQFIRATPVLMGGPSVAPTVTNTVYANDRSLKPPRGASSAQRAAFLAGETVAEESGCEGCHKLGAAGNNGPGPPLTHIGAARGPRMIAAALRNPTAPMPSFANLASTSPKDFHELVQFLAMLK